MNYSDPDEIFPVVDEEGNAIGESPRSVCHDGISRLLHPVVHIHLFNSKGELFLQKRSSKKDIQPGKWDTSVGGHISPGESVEAALKREASEELGLNDLQTSFIGKYIWESARERELVYSYKAVSDKFPDINPEEIEEGKFWNIDEIKSCLGKGLFTTNFEHEFKLYLLNITTFPGMC
jgi:isopentenyldiphosphate isomerase